MNLIYIQCFFKEGVCTYTNKFPFNIYLGYLSRLSLDILYEKIEVECARTLSQRKRTPNCFGDYDVQREEVFHLDDR